MEFKDYYTILGVKPSDDIKAIKTAYRRLARKYHPDVSTEKNAEAQFKEVAEAYIEMEVAVFLEETLAEQARTIRYSLPVYNAFGMVEQEIPKTLNVKIPAGVGDGERIRLKGQGGPGIDGGANGDLYLIIRIAPHPMFDVVGHDLEIVLPIAPWEAALGAKVPVPTLKDSILLTIPAGSQTGQRLRVKGKGLVSKKETGDLYAVIKVVMPPKPDEKSAALWQQLAETQTSFDPRKEWSKQNG